MVARAVVEAATASNHSACTYLPPALQQGFGGRNQDRPPTSKGWTKGGGGGWG